ncbi:MAG: hypothetical protein ABEL51_10445 [Salinibacter sp.]
MDRSQAVWILIFFLVTLGGAQETRAQVPADGPSSIGFANPDSTQPVRAYRLPSWHWSRWTLRAGGGAQTLSAYQDSLGVAADLETDRFGLNFSLNPTYRVFWEAEARRASLRLSPAFSLQRSGSTTSAGDRREDRNDLDVMAWFDLRGALREYLTDRVFLLASADGEADYDYQQVVGDDRETTRSMLDGRGSGRVGIGVGRVRVVTPVIRALRVRERLRTVTPGTSVSDDEVQAAARQLARRPGYQAVYDRPDKYFWRDFFERAGLSDQSPFETFYVADVLREPVGVRREGAELTVGTLGAYDAGEDVGSGRVLGRDEIYGDVLGGFARGQWYRNLSLRHQLGVDVRANYVNHLTVPEGTSVTDQGIPDSYVHLGIEGQWLWVLADRLQLDTRVRAHLLYRHDLHERGKLRPLNRYRLSSNLLVFVENSLSLQVGAHVRYGYDASNTDVRTARFRSGLQFNVQYVLSRALR